MGDNRKGILLMVLCGVLWSFGGVLIKLLPWNALVICGIRSSIAAVVIVLYMCYRKMRLLVTRRTLFAAVTIFLVFVFFLYANKLTTAANAIVLQYTGPVYVLLFSAVFQKVRVRRGDVIAVILTLAGIALFFLDQLGTGSALGNILALVSGVFFAAMFVITSGVSEEARMSSLLLAQLLSALVGIPLAFVYDTPITPITITSILLLGVVQLGIPYVLYSMAAKSIKPLQCSIIAVAEPLLNPVWVLLVTGERPSWWALVGGVVVLSTVTLWCVWGEKQRLLEEGKAAVMAAEQ